MISLNNLDCEEAGMSLLQKELPCLCIVSQTGWGELSRMESSLFSHPLFLNVLNISVLTKDSSSLSDEFLILLATSPAHQSTLDETHQHRLVKDLHHLVAYVEVSELPQKEESAYFFLVHTIRVGTQSSSVFVVINNSNLFTNDVYGFSRSSLPPKINHNFLGFVYIQEQMTPQSHFPLNKKKKSSEDSCRWNDQVLY